MNRILALALMIFSLLLLPTDEKSFAQVAAQNDQKAISGPEWKKLGEGVQVLRLWESVGPKWPQIALLRLSVEEYKDFLDHPVDYLNDHKVYPSEYPARKFVGCQLAPIPKKDPAKQNAECLLMLRHDITSTSVGTSSCSVQY